MIKYRYSENMRVLFIGINPHFGSFRRGIPFSNNKTFWYLLNRSGVISENPSDLRSDEKLKRIYDEKFTQTYRLGFVNMVDRPTENVTHLKKGEEDAGRERALKIIEQYKPKVACFIGKVTYERFSESKAFDFGWQKSIHNTKVFVMHFPVRGEARIRIDELREISIRSD